MNADPGTESIIESLKKRLRDEEDRTKHYVRRADGEREKLRGIMEGKLIRKQNDCDRTEGAVKMFRKYRTG